jgi:hypothetical protein
MKTALVNSVVGVRKKMKLLDARTFHENMVQLSDGKEDFTIEQLYDLRNILPWYFQDGFCTLGVFHTFKERIRDAIYKKLQGTTAL